MASLKDMRVRIASTKATQKITKAMQMVAASKLRRAQAAAEAARPYAERMEKVLGNIAATVADINSAPKLLAGTGQDQVHLLVVCTAERGLCGAFNSSIVRLARERINALIAAGKTVKILCVGRKGADQLRRQYAAQIIEVIELRVKTLGFEHADQVGSKIIELYEKGEFDVATLFFSRFKSVISQIPTALQIIPPVFEADVRGRAVGGLRIRAGRARHSDRAAAAQHLGAGVPRAPGKRRVRAGRAHVGDGQRHPQRRRNDPQADHHVQPHASGDDHQGTDRDHLRRRSAL